MKTKKILVFLVVTLMSSVTCLTAALASAAQGTVGVNDFFTATDIVITENVNGNQLKDSAEKTLFAKDDKTGVKVLGKQGGTLAIKPKMYGAFEMDFRVWSNTSGTAQLKGFSIKFDDGENSFIVHLEAADTSVTQVPSARVSLSGGNDKYAYHYLNEWNDLGYKLHSYRCNSYGSPIFGSTFVNAGVTRFLPGTNQPTTESMSTKIGFNPSAMEVYTYLYNFNTKASHKVVVWKLNETKSISGPAPTEEIKTINTFKDEYSVTLTYDSVAEGKDGQMVIYSINGNSLQTTNGKFDAAAPEIVSIPEYQTTIPTGERFELPTPIMRELFNGKIEFEGTVGAKLDGETVDITGVGSGGGFVKGCYIVAQTGKYTVEYTPVRGGVSGTSKTIEFTAESDEDISDKKYSDILSSDIFTIPERSAKGSDLKDSVQNVLFPNENKSGAIFSSNEDGGFAFKNKLSGLFEMDFRVWSDVTMSTADAWKNFKDVNSYNTREVSITLDDGVNKFTVHISAGDEWKAIIPTARVSYGDGTDRYAKSYNDATGNFQSYRVNSYGTWLMGTSFVNQARGYGAWLTPDKSLTTRIGFDPSTMEVYAYTIAPSGTEIKKHTIWKLNERATSFAGMETEDSIKAVENQPIIAAFGSSYNVSVAIDAQDGQNGQIIVFSVNEQDLRTSYDGYIKNTTGARLAKRPLVLPGEVGRFYELPEIMLCDILDGNNVMIGQLNVINADGEIVTLQNLGQDGAYVLGCGFTPAAAGEYTFSCVSIDSQGKKGEISFVIMVNEVVEYPEPGEGEEIPKPNDPPPSSGGEIGEPNVKVPPIGNSDKGCGGCGGNVNVLNGLITFAGLAIICLLSIFYIVSRRKEK